MDELIDQKTSLVVLSMTSCCWGLLSVAGNLLDSRGAGFGLAGLVLWIENLPPTDLLPGC